MTKQSARGYRNIVADKETESIIYEGANQTQLTRLFRADKTRVKARLLHVPPDGRRMGTDVWKIATAAPHLVKPLFDVENYIRTMNYADLPPHLTKEFWAGQRTKQAFEEDEGDLWRTAEVVEAIADLLRLVRMSVMLIPDQLEKVTTLSPKQRDLVASQTDGLLDELRKSVLRSFSEQRTGDVGAEDVKAAIDRAEAETHAPEANDGEEEDPFADL